MSYASDLTDDQWALVEPVFNAPSKRGRKHAGDLRTVVDAMLYRPDGVSVALTPGVVRTMDASLVAVPPLVAQRHLGARLTVLHAAASQRGGRAQESPSMVVIDTHLARGASNGEFTFHDRGGAPTVAPRPPSGSWRST